MKNLFKTTLVASLSDLFAYVIGRASGAIGSLPGRIKTSHRSEILGIEAGKKGWGSTFFQELAMSAEEHSGFDQVHRFSIDRDKPYLSQILNLLAAHQITQIVIDPRTGPQKLTRGLVSSFVLSVAIRKQGIKPLVILPDASLRRHRMQAILLTSYNGVIISFVDPKSFGRTFNRSNVLSPSPIPISKKTFTAISREKKLESFTQLSFLGSVYPKRDEFFQSLSSKLSEVRSPVKLDINRKSEEVGPSDYWKILSECQAIITTTFQQPPVTKEYYDYLNLNQMVFRFSEALASGTALFAMKTSGVEEFFTPNVDFVEFSNASDLLQKIDYYSKNANELEKIRHSGYKKFERYILEEEFWTRIQKSFGKINNQ